MKTVSRFFVTVILASAAGLCGQAVLAAPPSALAAAIHLEISGQEKQFMAAVEAMPEGRFDFSPERLGIPGAELDGVRTFALQARHVAADNFAIWAPLTGKPEPAGLNAPNGPEAMTSRGEILKFLQDSFAYAHAAAARLTSENLLEPVEFRGRKVTRVSLVVLALTHVSDHYGQMVEYLRLAGIVPPASRRAQTPAPSPPAGR